MRSVRVPYQVIDNKLAIRQLSWPRGCACCGQESPPSSLSVSAMVRGKSSTSEVGMYRTTYTSGYPVSWDVPMCQRCALHDETAKSSPPVGVLGIVGVAAALGVGYGLYSMDLAYNEVAIVGYALFLAILGSGLYEFFAWSIRRHKSKAVAMMGPTCTAVTGAVTPAWDMDFVYLKFTHDLYGSTFAQMNGAA